MRSQIYRLNLIVCTLVGLISGLLNGHLLAGLVGGLLLGSFLGWLDTRWHQFRRPKE